jgi:hypothetical protein
MSCGSSNIFNETSGDNIVYECANVGSGLGLFSSESVTPTETTFNFKSLLAGSNINLMGTANDITISSIDTGVATLNNVGGFAAVGQSITGSTLNLRTITGANGITATQNTDDITIGSTQSITSLGAGQALLTAGLPSATIRSLVQGTGISIASNANTLTINNTGVVTVDNIGSGADISAGIVGPVLSLRGISGSGSTTVTQSVDTINVSTPVLTIANQPSGGSALLNTVFPNATVKGLVAGTGISLSNTVNSVTINNTQTPTNTVTNLGGSAEVLVDVLAGSVRARTLQSQGYALVNQSGNLITIGARGPSNIGVGEFIYSGDVGFDNQFKSLVPNGNIQVTSDPSNIYFRPLMNNLLTYSGLANMNTRPNGNPSEGMFLGFGGTSNAILQDQFQAEIGDLTGNEFIGWIAPFRGTFKSVKVFIQSMTNVTLTERVDVYLSLHRTKSDPGTLNIWNEMIQSYNTSITAGEFIQRDLPIGVDIDVDWGVYCVIYCHRPEALGQVDPLQFSVSCGAIIQTSDAFA